jgi:DNA invertase Pin-like site-specific DNA recombinase
MKETAPPRRLRCAIYTRKSSEEGLDMEFNSLDAQRESCEAYIASQRAEGWVGMRERYDDGGFSGGTLERPGLKNLLADIEAGLVDVIVVYKIDRLSRSLMDFSRLVEVFDKHGVTFVSITQSFNTTTSMGRLTLNILLSFAQFEREVTGERIRDKIAASRRKGMWMGGFVPMGYDVAGRKLVINDAEAATVRHMFQRFVELGSATTLTRELVANGAINKRGKPIDKGFLYKLFRNRVYIGEAVHKGTSYPGEHHAIIDQPLWDQVHAILQESPRQRAANTRAKTPALLKGLIFTATGIAMTPTATKKGSRHYRYYTSMDAIRNRAGEGTDGFVRLNAGMVENAVVEHIRTLLRTPEIAARAVDAARRTDLDIDECDVVAALSGLDGLWESLFPAEQARIARLLIERVTVSADGMAVDLRTEGLGSVIREMVTPKLELAA